MPKWRIFLLSLFASAGWCQTESSKPIASASLRLNSETDKQVQSLQLHVKLAPSDYAGYDELGSAFFQKARETGDIAYYDLAEQTMAFRGTTITPSTPSSREASQCYRREKFSQRHA